MPAKPLPLPKEGGEEEPKRDPRAKKVDPPEEVEPPKEGEEEPEFTEIDGIKVPKGKYYREYFDMPIDNWGNPFDSPAFDPSNYTGNSTYMVKFFDDGGKGDPNSGADQAQFESDLQGFKDDALSRGITPGFPDMSPDDGNNDPNTERPDFGGQDTKPDNPYGLNSTGSGYKFDITPEQIGNIRNSQTGSRWRADIEQQVPWNNQLPTSNDPNNPQYWPFTYDNPPGGFGGGGGSQQPKPEPTPQQVAQHAITTGQMPQREKITFTNWETGAWQDVYVYPTVTKDAFGWSYSFDIWNAKNSLPNGGFGWEAGSMPIGGSINYSD